MGILRSMNSLLDRHSDLLCQIATGWALIAFVILTILESRQPRIYPSEIIHEESWRSGVSYRSWWARLGNARNCLHIIFLADRILIRCHYPFSVIGRFYGLDLAIPYQAVTAYCVKRSIWSLFRPIIELTFRSDVGSERVAFTVCDLDAVLAILRDRCSFSEATEQPA